MIKGKIQRRALFSGRTERLRKVRLVDSRETSCWSVLRTRGTLEQREQNKRQSGRDQRWCASPGPRNKRTWPKERSSSRLLWKATTLVALTTEPLPIPHVSNGITWEYPANKIIRIRIRAAYCLLRATTRESLGRNLGEWVMSQRGRIRRGELVLLLRPLPTAKSCSFRVLTGSPGLFITTVMGKGSRSGEGGKSGSGWVRCHVQPWSSVHFPNVVFLPFAESLCPLLQVGRDPRCCFERCLTWPPRGAQESSLEWKNWTGDPTPTRRII